MIERPLLFSGAMVRATLSDLKTVTRRALNARALQHIEYGARCDECHPLPVEGRIHPNDASYYAGFSPYGQAGDRLWVRETFYAFGRWETRYSEKKGRDEWHFVDMTLECGKQYRYLASMAGDRPARPRHAGATPAWWKRPAIFMPRAASRILLEITAVRVERLQDITADQAMAEGISHAGDGLFHVEDSQHLADDPRESFASLWESINGDGSWAANPWCWAVEFKRVTP